MTHDDAMLIVFEAARRYAQELADDPDKEPQDEAREKEIWEALDFLERATKSKEPSPDDSAWNIEKYGRVSGISL